MGSLTRTEKATYLKMNGWWSHYHEDCWFESSKDNLYVEEGTGIMKGFRPESEGITLNKAYNNQKNMSKEENEWANDPDIQNFLERQDAIEANEEEYGIYTVGGLTNDKEGKFMKFINKINIFKK
jgi:hypothetical protein